MKHTARQYAATLLAATEGKDHKDIDSVLAQFLTALRKDKARRMLPAIVKAFQTLSEEHAGKRSADVTTARSHEAHTIQHALEKALDQKVTVQHHMNPKLLGGIVVRIGDTLIDASVRSRLAILRTKLREARPLDSAKGVAHSASSSRPRGRDVAQNTII